MTRKILVIVVGALVCAAIGFGVAGARSGMSPQGEGGHAQRPVGRGPAKADALVQSAVVNSDGTLARSYPSTGVTSANLNPGRYEVLFPRKMRQCTYTATLADAGTTLGGSPGFVFVTGRDMKPRGVFVHTWDSTGTDTDLGFMVMVACKP